MRVCCLLLLTLLLLPALTNAAETDEARARNLINSLGCKGCHSFDGSGANFAPSLDKLGNRLTAAQIKAKLLDPSRGGQESMMPSYSQFDPQQIEILADFLAARQ